MLIRSMLGVRQIVLLFGFTSLLIVQAPQYSASQPAAPFEDFTPPAVRFEGLHHYARPYIEAPLSVTATDDIGISRVEFYVDQNLVAVNNVVPNLPTVLVSFNWASTSVGKHILLAKAFDASGNSKVTAVAVIARSLGTSPTPTPTPTPTPIPTPTPTPIPTPTASPTPPPPSGSTITLQPSIRYQTMRGLSASGQAGQLYSAAWNNYKNPLLDASVSDLGLSRIRLTIASGAENPTDYFAQWRAGQITESQYNAKRYEIINDDGDSNTINPAGFKWSQLDSTIETLVLPLQQRLNARGESLWVDLTYIDFGSSTFEHKTSPAEYAEFVLATYRHVQSVYGFIPNTWGIVAEPDSSTANWSASQVSQAIKAAGDKLAANGFTPAFTTPSTTNTANAPVFIDQIAQTSGAMQYVSEFSYHRYCCAADNILRDIANRAVQYNKQTAMLEWMGADYNTLHQDLKVARNSSWQQFTLAFPNQPDNGAQYYLINDSVPSNPIVTIGSRTKFFRQYFKFIRPGAQRIEALSINSNFDPLAFISTNGKYVVVVKASSGGTFGIQGLTPGTYGLKYTTATQYDIDLPDITIASGQALATNIPAAGVITIYGR